MQVSARADYALRTAAELARAKVEGTGPLKGERISEEQGIPKKFMENILLDLKQSGIVRIQRGAAGGYWLARPAGEVVLADISGPSRERSPTSGANGRRLSSTGASPRR